MNNNKMVTYFVLSIAFFSLIATSVGIFSKSGQGPYEFTTMYGDSVTIYGKGVYEKMAAEVAIQGIAQDFITLLLAIPLLLVSLLLYNKGSLKGYIVLTGTVFYFFLTYLFYLMMAVFNYLFLVYVILLSLSFFTIILLLNKIQYVNIKDYVSRKFPHKWVGLFLLYNSISIGILWLLSVIPPIIKNEPPKELFHYTTLVVQGLDLALFLPISFIAGWLLFKKHNLGYIMAPIYLVFLSILMTALSAKLFWMHSIGADVFPPIIIIPVTNLVTILLMVITLKGIKENHSREEGART